MKWYDRMVRYPEVWVLTALALVTRLWHIGWPPAIVFDEVYFRTFAADYLSGNYFFDIHPPFVKLLFAGVAMLFHLTPDQILSGYAGGIILRTAPAVAGAALVPLLYVILRQLNFSRRIAILGGTFVLFDNALLVESRFVLMDSILLLAGFGAVSAYLALRKAKGHIRWVGVMLLALLLGVLVTTKWTGLAIALLLTITWLIEGVRQRIEPLKLAVEAAITIMIITSIYVGSFALHFSLLNHSGEGDAFMSERFQSTLIGNVAYNPSAKLSFWDKFIELNGQMYSAQNTLNHTTHPYASRWYSWPFMARPVYFWQSETQAGGTQGNIYLLGNPFIWAFGTIGVLASLLAWIIRPNLLGHRRHLVAFLLAGYVVNFIPFSFIERPMFLYHYLFALVISILIGCILYEQLFEWQSKKYGKSIAHYTYWIMMSMAILGFLYFLPLSYGWPLSPSDLQQRMWLPSWR